MRALIFFILLIVVPLGGLAQYAPRDNWPGSTAIPADSSIFINWATGVVVERGFRDIRNPQSGMVEAGLPPMILGTPDGQTVSLGDRGMASLQFDPPLVNGPGADFAVFENGFHIHPDNDSDFLELAFVEVSSDGFRWVRFAALSDNDTSKQLNTFDGSRASKVYNLAGKYVGRFGTPFDLEELKDSSGIDLMAIRYLRVIDVVGSLNDSFASRDSRGYKINDPFPTDFQQGGFDLDAVGVIYNQHSPNGISELASFRPYPNPCLSGQSIRIGEDGIPLNWVLYSYEGKTLAEGNEPLIMHPLTPGIYLVEVKIGQQRNQFKLIIR